MQFFDHRQKEKKRKGVMMKLMAIIIEHPYHYEDVKKRAYSSDAEMMQTSRD